jgi:hypothetical protein
MTRPLAAKFEELYTKMKESCKDEEPPSEPRRASRASEQIDETFVANLPQLYLTAFSAFDENNLPAPIFLWDKVKSVKPPPTRACSIIGTLVPVQKGGVHREELDENDEDASCELGPCVRIHQVREWFCQPPPLAFEVPADGKKPRRPVTAGVRSPMPTVWLRSDVAWYRLMNPSVAYNKIFKDMFFQASLAFRVVQVFSQQPRLGYDGVVEALLGPKGRDGPAVKVKERKERTEQQLLECPELVIAQLIEFKGKTSGTSSFIGTLRRKKSIEMKRLKKERRRERRERGEPSASSESDGADALDDDDSGAESPRPMQPFDGDWSSGESDGSDGRNTVDPVQAAAKKEAALERRRQRKQAKQHSTVETILDEIIRQVERRAEKEIRMQREMARQMLASEGVAEDLRLPGASKFGSLPSSKPFVSGLPPSLLSAPVMVSDFLQTFGAVFDFGLYSPATLVDALGVECPPRWVARLHLALARAAGADPNRKETEATWPELMRTLIVQNETNDKDVQAVEVALACKEYSQLSVVERWTLLSWLVHLVLETEMFHHLIDERTENVYRATQAVVASRKEWRDQKEAQQAWQDTPVRNEFLKALTAIMKAREARMFSKPVDPVALGLADYCTIVKKPIDLGTIKRKLLDGGYCNSLQVVADVRRVWSNAILYNGEHSEVTEAARRLSATFEEKFADFPEDPPGTLFPEEEEDKEDEDEPVNPKSQYLSVQKEEARSKSEAANKRRSSALGMDRYYRRYWWFEWCPHVIAIEIPVPLPKASSTQIRPTTGATEWRCIDKIDHVETILSRLNDSGIRESILKANLLHFKEPIGAAMSAGSVAVEQPCEDARTNSLVDMMSLPWWCLRDGDQSEQLARWSCCKGLDATREAVLELESSILPPMLSKKWLQRRPQWLTELHEAKTFAQVATFLRELKESGFSQIDDWQKRCAPNRGEWLAGLSTADSKLVVETLNSTAREDDLVIYLSSGHGIQQQQVPLLAWDSNVRSTVVCQCRIAKAAYANQKLCLSAVFCQPCHCAGYLKHCAHTHHDMTHAECRT